jgi:UDP-N-acetylmuramate--alanine ligase
VPAIDKLVYTGAHHGAQNAEVKWAASRNVPTLNYARAVGEFFADKKQICVCGVGGKTTTAAMIATILHDVGLDPSWIIGTSEIPSLPAAGRLGQGDWAVIEGDEYAADPAEDKTPKFMYLNPKIVVCTNIRHDHPDVYPTEQDTIQAYLKFFAKLPKDGLLLMSSQVESVIPAKAGIYINNLYRFRVKPGMTEKKELGMIGGGSKMAVYDEDQELKRLVKKAIQVPGEYNIKNAMAAAAAAREVGISEKDILAGLSQYRGAKRRFEFIGEIGGSGGIRLYDDYAHHPAEIQVLLQAAREKFPGRRIIFVFQPHTFSRTKALFSQFAENLKLADEVVMYPIFASAREEKDESVSSQMLTEEIRRRGGRAVSVKSGTKLVEYLVKTARRNEIIFTVGAGNLYELHQSIIDGLKRIGQKPAGG